MPYKNIEDARSYSKKRYLAKKEEYKKRGREYYFKNKEKCDEASRLYRLKYPVKSKLAQVKSKKKVKMKVFEHYGGIPPKCACCGELHIEFLTLDHVNNDGAKHRKEKGTGVGVFADIINRSFPKGKFQVLCFNCNCAKAFRGGCPHKREI